MRILIRFFGLITLIAVFLIMNGDSLAARGWLLQSLCEDPRLYCITVKKGESWQSMFADPFERDLVMRINRMNTHPLPGMKIAIPKDLSDSDSMEYAPFSTYRVSTGKKIIVYSPSLHAWAAYGPAGNIIRWGPASSGQNWCSDLGRPCLTPSGTFKVYEKRGLGCISSKFPKPNGGAPMPYCMFFKGGFAMHASNAVLGYNSSHGCLRMFFEDAQWLNLNFVDIGTQVVILPYPLNRYTDLGDEDDADNDYNDDQNDN